MYFPPLADLATIDIVSVTPDATVSEALRRMAARGVRNIVVQRGPPGQREYGLLTAPDVLSLRFSRSDLEVRVGSIECRPLPALPKQNNILDVLERFDGAHGYAAVVEDDGELYGIVSNTDILGSLDPQLMLQRQCLGDLLHRHSIKTREVAATLADVLVELVRTDDAVIVTEEGKAVGIVTTQDAIRLLMSDAPLSDPVRWHMSAPLHTVSENLTVGEAVATLREKHYKRLVVEEVGSGRVIGVITQHDLIGVAYSRWADLMRRHARDLQDIIDVLERKAAHLEQVAATDSLTGAANRAALEGILRSEEHRFALAASQPYAIILFDIDRFKRINDTWGHGKGDVVLKEVVHHAQGLLRKADTLARWGGEEFAILLPETSLAEAGVVASKLCESLGQTEIDTVGRVTASFGVAAAHVGESGGMVVTRADDALYEAKRRGRNCVVEAGAGALFRRPGEHDG